MPKRTKSDPTNYEEELNGIYKRKEYAILSKSKFATKVKKDFPHIPNKQIKDFIGKQQLQQTYTTKKFKGYFKIIAPPRSFQIDLFFMDQYSQHNKQTIFLIFVDVLSRKVFIEPLSSKNMGTVFNGVRKLINKIGKVNSIMSDDEFNKKTYKDLFESKDIKFSSVVSQTEHLNKGNKLGIVDTATRTIKKLIKKYMDLENTPKFLGVLPELVDIYNTTPHTSLKNKTPNGMYADEKAQRKLMEDGRKINQKISDSIDIKIGDYVRKSTDKSKFEKEKPRFTKSVYVVFDKVFNKYTLIDEDGKVDDRLYKHTELLKIEPQGHYSLVDALDKHYGKTKPLKEKRKRDAVEEAKTTYKKAKKTARRLKREGIDPTEFTILKKRLRSGKQ
jgi:hypothetical protein